MIDSSLKRLIVLISMIAAILLLLFIYRDEISSEDDLVIIMSCESGFYDAPIYLELSTKCKSDIYYTTDGSVPDRNSKRYEGSIYIDDASDNENVLCNTEGLSLGYSREEEILGFSDYNEWAQYEYPDFLIDKCTIIRAVAYDKEGHSGKVSTASYYVDYEDREAYDGMYMVSITADYDDLFSYEKGIFVLGKGFDEYVEEESSKPLEERNPDSDMWYGNFRNEELKPDANIEIYDENKNLILNQECSIDIKGGSSRAFITRSIDVKAHERSDGTKRFENDIFNEGESLSAITLFGGGNDILVNYMDYLVNALVKDRDFVTSEFIPCSVFINGEYWGNYHISKKFDAAFFADTYGVDGDDVLMVKDNVFILGEEYSYLYEQDDYVWELGIKKDELYYELCRLYDMQSLIDYYATEVYIGRLKDWPMDMSNMAKWRTVKGGDSEYADGLWRYVLYDVNTQALQTSDIDSDILATTLENDWLLLSLTKSPIFKERFAVSMMDIANNNFSEERYKQLIDEYRENLLTPMVYASYRFYNESKEEEILARLEDIEYFLDNRRDYVIKELISNLKLEEGVTEVTVVNTSDEEIRVNTSVINCGSDNAWSGKYLSQFAIELQAMPSEGAVFSGWKITADDEDISSQFSDEEMISIELKRDGNIINRLKVEAVFEDE